MARFVGTLARHPARVSFAWYAVGVFVGALILAHPVSRVETALPIATIDAVFTATSAVCVTGLNVRSTAHDFSLLGQATILALVQLGGIGIITVTTFVTLKLGGRQNLHNRTLLAETLGSGNEPDLKQVLRRVVRFTLVSEAIGASLLTIRFLFDHPPLAALGNGLFYSITAFCNAGFALDDDSLILYQGDWMISLTIMLLLIIGGIGYPVMIDIVRNWRGTWGDFWSKLMLHTKLMLIGTALLLAIGTISMLLFEWDHSLAHLTIEKRFLVALFQTASSRTAGYHTVNIGALRDATLFVMILLMMIGGGPCSTAGGFKVSTLAVLILRAWTTFWGGSRVNVARRTIPEATIDRAITTALLFAVVSVIGLILLLSFEQFHFADDGLVSGELFLDATFEVASALGTVGLTTGLTPHLTTAGKIVIIVLMFVGRLGPITVAAAVSLGDREDAIAYAREEPLIG